MIERPRLSRKESRAIDQLAIEQFGMSGLVLMENAGRGCAEILLRHAPRKVVICCGPGNNGGDGYVIARHLDLQGVDVVVTLHCPREKIKGDAAANFEILNRAGIKVLDLDQREDFQQTLNAADWIVDALLGTGVSGPPRAPIATTIRQINQADAKVLAVDIPSGLDCDTGQTHDPTIAAQLTATFVTPKTGFENAAAHQVLGDVHIVDIGAPRALLKRAFAAADKT